jgi:hypothetical protein
MRTQHLIKTTIFIFQKWLLLLSSLIFCTFVKLDPDLWVIGVDETANYINFLTGVFERSYSVSLSSNKFYKNNIYNFCFSQKLPPYLTKNLRLLMGPILMGYLLNRANSFFYIGNTGFLISFPDGREYEFKTIKSRNKKLVTLFSGSDIRSLKLSLDHAKKLDIEVMASYYDILFPHCLSQEYEDFLKRLATSANRHSNIIFNAPVDQISYLREDAEPIFYIFPDKKFHRNDHKFKDIKTIRIVHAPSSPIIKGTQIIRAAIKKLKVIGYTFEYKELINVPNEVVLEHLRNTHIVVNELYAFVPGVFGIEAMASHCALITSADRYIEASLPEGANEAWLVTKYWEIFDNLKQMLDEPSLIKTYADKGFDWTFKNCRETVSRQHVASLIAQKIQQD